MEDDRIVGRRKRNASGEGGTEGSRPAKLQRANDSTTGAKQVIALLEEQILDSQKHYNNIVKLQKLADREQNLQAQKPRAAIALCRIFCRLLSAKKLETRKDNTANETKIVQWLKTRLNEFQDFLLDILRDAEGVHKDTALTLYMQLFQVELECTRAPPKSVWKSELFGNLLRALLEGEDTDDILSLFVERYVNVYDDVRHYTFWQVAEINKKTSEEAAKSHVLSNSLDLLSSLDTLTEEKTKLDQLFHTPNENNSSRISLANHRTNAQQAWLAVLNFRLDKSQRKTILSHITTHVVPWFSMPELLMDFLTDTFEGGGASALLALSGLFYLMQHKNLEYPDFFRKLYSLLDENILHSKHRSRFFRLLDTCMASTHLPAALVASFIKRLSRLALHAPPGGIVAVVPLVYNLLQSHPTCTFMIHREPRCEADKELIELDGAEEPFDMGEKDPMRTRAIDSCLWELVTLQSHYHPHVASLAKIISEPFTKPTYNLEDFLDYSYANLIEAELSKEVKREPVVEYVIPKRIFVDAEGGGSLETLMGLIGNEAQLSTK